MAATSEPGRVVTNGMSQYSRAERNANAGLVVGIAPGDFRRTKPPSPTPGAESAARYAREAAALRDRGPKGRAPARRSQSAAPAGVPRLPWAVPATRRRASGWVTSWPHAPPPPWAK